jgi:hypothetical protein
MQNFVRQHIENYNSQYVAVLKNKVIGWADIILLERNTTCLDPKFSTLRA